VGRTGTYTLSELESRSGFDKRTISYYIQEMLLPKVGRRGRRTRYPEEFLDRLMFIRRVRDLQDAGQLRAVTLSEIREVMESCSPEQIRSTSRRRVSAETLRRLFEEPELELSAMAIPARGIASPSMAEATMAEATMVGSALEDSDAAEASKLLPASMRRRALSARAESAGAPRAQAPQPSMRESSAPLVSRLRTLLQAVEGRARLGAQRSEGRTRERLTRVPITQEIILSVRNISDEDAHLVEELAEFLRRAGELD